VIFDEISLPDLSVAECSIKNANHSFQVRRYYIVRVTYLMIVLLPFFFHPSIRLPFTSSTIFFFFYVYTCVVCVFRLYIRSSGPWLWGYFRPVAHSSPPTIAVIVIGQAQIRSKTGGIRAPPSRNALAPIGLSLCVCVLYQCVFFSLYNRQSQAKM
jgi:hypothetical protein